MGCLKMKNTISEMTNISDEIINRVDTRKMGFPGGVAVKKQPANAEDARDTSSVPGLGRSPGEGNDNPLQYSCLENTMDRGLVWQAIVHGIAKSRTRLSNLSHLHTGTVEKKILDLWTWQ